MFSAGKVSAYFNSSHGGSRHDLHAGKQPCKRVSVNAHAYGIGIKRSLEAILAQRQRKILRHGVLLQSHMFQSPVGS